MDFTAVLVGEDMRLNNMLKHKGLTIQELSQQTGINYYTLQKYSSGVREPSIKNARILGKFFNVDWWTFFEDKNI